MYEEITATVYHPRYRELDANFRIYTDMNGELPLYHAVGVSGEYDFGCGKACRTKLGALVNLLDDNGFVLTEVKYDALSV